MIPLALTPDALAQRRRRIFRWGLLLVVVLALIYGLTLQVDINGSANEYAEDTGEFQNVLTQWGVPHPTGYPLYSFTGAVFASALRLVGVVPAAAASAFSELLSVLALLGVYVLLCEWQITPPLAAGSALLAGLLFPFWYHAAVAEVYAMLTASIVLAFLIAARWRIDHNSRHLLELAFVFGLAVGHHRLAVVAAPALAVYIGPQLIAAIRRRPLLILAAGLSLLLSALAYAYLPLRAGSAWVYGDPGTWDGLWRIITAREYSGIIRPTPNVGALEGGLAQSLAVMADLMTWPILLASVVGLLVGALNQTYRRAALTLITLAVTTVVFVSILSKAVFMPAALMSAMLAVMPGIGFLFHIFGERLRAVRWSGGAVLIAGAVALIGLNGWSIWSITHDPYARVLIDKVAAAHLDQAAPRPVVFSIWGRDYFALDYAHSVTGELARVAAVDSHANVKTLIDSGQTMFVVPAALYYDRRSIAWWDKRLGHAYLSSFDGELVQISDRPVTPESAVPPDQPPVPMGEAIVLRGWQLRPLSSAGTWQLTLYWQARSTPERDYSVFVHASDRDVIDAPDAIIAQADSDAPVFGWAPTSRWQPDEIVRDDHILVVPADRVLKTVAAGLYYQDEAGAFHNLGQQIIPVPAP